VSSKAIIYVSDVGDQERWRDECVRYCTCRGYEITAVVLDDHNGARWPDVLATVVDGHAEVIVVARADHLPAHRHGRIEVAADRVDRRAGRRRPTLRDEPGHLSVCGALVELGALLLAVLPL